MSYVPKNWKRRRRRVTPEQQAKNARSNLRRKRLSQPITLEQIRSFAKCLVAVPSAAGDECWLYLGSGIATTGSGKATTDEIAFKIGRYANRKHNGEPIGPHQFALAASLGVPVSELEGFDTHHASELGGCFGYRCCNPEHLMMRESREHARHSKEENAVISAFVGKRYAGMVKRLVCGTAPREVRPVELGASTLRRVFAGMPFLIRKAQWVDVIEDAEEVTKSVNSAESPHGQGR